MERDRVAASPLAEPDSPAAWRRLWLSVALGTIGSVGMWSFVVALPAVQADFGIARGEASLPFTLTMIGFGVGGVVMGRLADRFGIVVPIAAAARSRSALGYVVAGLCAQHLAVRAGAGAARPRRLRLASAR